MKYHQLKILLADEHPIFRFGLKKLMEERFGFRVADEARNGRELLEKVSQTEFDMLVMDISYGDTDGIALVRRIMAQNDKLPALVLSGLTDENVILGVLKAGALGYVLKTTAPEALLPALKAVAHGQSYLSPEVSSQLLPTIMKQQPDPQPVSPAIPTGITAREKQVLRLIYDEHTNPEIAEQLNISRRTVDTHRKNLLHKIGARNTVGLIKFALREGVV
jgi:DNA-binding NarL/FixJ family response regulator